MDTIDLLEPLFADGIAAPSYFNGRVLSAEDLLLAADAERQVDRLLGQAVGEGVVHGLEVVPAPRDGEVPVVRVEAGLAINRRGATIRLPARQDVRLIVTSPVSGGAPGFADCHEARGPAFTGRAGVYVLTIGPVRGNRGMAPVTGLRNTTAECNVREVVAGVQFRLIPLPGLVIDPQRPDRLRNAVAAACLGIEALHALKGAAPGADIAAYGAIDELRQAGALTTCEVPLATVRINDLHRLTFVDRWSVRRRPVRPAVEQRWPHLVGDRRVAEAEALFLQFQDHLLDLAPSGFDASQVEAPAHFAWLPPAGVLPVGSRRFTPSRFFAAQTLAPITADHALARQVIHDSFYREPFSAEDPDVQLQVLTFPDHPEYVVFCRVDRLPAAQPPETPPEAGPGGFDIRVTWSADPAAITDVWVQDERGTRYPVELDPRWIGTIASPLFPWDEARYRVRGLQPGPYWVKVQAKNYPIMSVPATVIAKTSVLVSVRLTRREHPCPPKHKVTKPVDKFVVDPVDRLVDNAGNFYGGFAVMHDYRSDARALPETTVQMPRMQLSDEVRQLVGNLWECWLEVDPDVLVATDFAPEIWVDPVFDPRKPPPPDPYAWMKIADVVYPLVLIPQERTLPRSIPATKAEIPEVGIEQYAAVLEPMGLGDMDVLAGAWGDLIEGTLDVAPGAVDTVAQRLVEQATQFLAGKQYYPGVSAEVGQKLAEAANEPIGNDVWIANASVDEIVSQLREVAGDAVGDDTAARALAERMQATARGFVPRGAWSLDDLGLDATTRGALAVEGVTTKGALVQAPSETLTAVVSATGANAAAIDTAVSEARIDVAFHRGAEAPEPTLTDLGFTASETSRLIEEHGIGSATELAATDVDLTTLGIDEARATELRRQADEQASRKWEAVRSEVEAGAVDLAAVRGRAASTATFNNVIRIVGGLSG